ncbi:MAG: ribonuclease, Rne/Rng family [Blastococcus sp.]|nr:ribonuclease, Rne/Rng family [Blastococcus sp.]
MAENLNENENTEPAVESAVGTSGEPAVDAAAPATNAVLPDEADADPAEDEAPAEEAPAQEPAAEEAPAEPVAAAEPEPDPEPVLPRFGAEFSSPEPTAVVARPRRRATRPALPVDPFPTEPPAAAAPPAPAFIAFVAPTETDAPAPRRRARRPAQEPAAEDSAAAGGGGDGDTEATAPKRTRSRRRPAGEQADAPDQADKAEVEDVTDEHLDTDERQDTEDTEDTGAGSRRRRRGRRGRGRGRSGEDSAEGDDASDDTSDETGHEQTAESEGDDLETEDGGDGDEAGTGSSTRRRRRRRRRTGGAGGDSSSDEVDDDDRPERAGRNGRLTSDDDVRGVAGSTRLEAKRQRRRDGRDTGRRRTPILSESEFLARREAVDRKMVIRQRGERTQIAVLEDDVLVEHYVTQAQSTSFAGNVYLGRVQNVLPSMEAAFVDIGKGRNAVLYAGEVNWDAAGLSGKSRSIEQALKSGDKVLVQVTKDPIGHKGARLTQQINLPGRFLVYVPGGSMTGISRKLPDTERQRLKDILKKIVPEDAGVIIRTAAEGASEEELTRDVNRLTAQWEVIQKKAESTSSAPTLLYGEPDLAIRVIRDVFNEDFKELVVQGDDAWDTVEAYVAHVSPELTGRLTRFTGEGDVFHNLRIDEQLAKALDRKVWLPSGGSLVIDRTEAMTVVDVNTGKFVGSGGNLEQTVTRNNMEAAEEIVRQLRLRDIGGIIVIDFIDMVLESNRDLVLRRLTECLGRDRTKHQVAEVTSLGLVQMTRKRVGQGLLEVFSEPCEHCRGRGVLVHIDPIDEKRRNSGGNSGGSTSGGGSVGGNRRDRISGSRDDGPAHDTTATDDASETSATGSGSPDGEAAEGSRGGGRRNRGRRNRGQSGEDRAAEDAAVLAGARVDDGTADAEPAVDTPVTGDGNALVAEISAAEDVPAAEFPAETATPGAATSDAATPETATPETATPEAPAAENPSGIVPETEPVDSAPAPAVARPRRRRAASRPAGPPV